MFASLFQKESQKQMNREKLETIVKNLNLYSAKLVREAEEAKLKAKEMRHEESIGAYFLKFMRACKLSESAYIRTIFLI